MLTLRKAILKDLNALLKLEALFKKDRLSFLPRHLKPLDYNVTREMFKKSVCEKDRNIILALDGVKIVGYAMNVIKPVVSKKGSFLEAKISDLFVLKAYRDKGIASALYRESLKWFKQRKCSYLQIFVYDKNPARQIYKKWGFKDFVVNMKKKL